MDDGAATGLNGQSDGASGVALAQILEPLVEVLGRMSQRAGLGFAGGIVEGEGVFLVAPVQADPGCGRRLQLSCGIVWAGVHVTMCWLMNAGRSSYSETCKVVT